MFACALLVSITSAGAESSIRFEDVTESSGIEFRHDNGWTGDWQYPEIVGGGCGMLDFDGDGRLDLVFIQSGTVPEKPADADPPDRSADGGSRLYRNVTGDTGDGVRFRDVTGEAGLATRGYGMGVATGDFDGDGRVDLYITNLGPNSLWRNDDDGFSDITGDAGVGDPGFSTSASFGDLDGDGDLDLYVVNYVEYDPRVNPRCYAPSTRRDYCGPAVFPAQPDTLYLGDGQGGFDHHGEALQGGEPSRGLGVVIADFNDDHRPDIYVANDGDANLLWRNLGGGRFEEFAWPSGSAVNRDGQMEAGMGVEAADLDGDGRLDLFLTHLTGESNTFYRGLDEGLFEDDTAAMGLATPSLPYTGFGTGSLDLDLDGRLDLYIANGAVRVIKPQREAGVDYPLREPDLVLRNHPGGGFEKITPRLADTPGPPAVGRGAAFGDVDNDGREDVLVCNSHGAPRLLVNRTATDNRWLGLRITRGEPAVDALGARVHLLDDGEPGLLRRVATDGSYLSASDPRVLFGLGGDARKRRDVLVTWPDGERERFTDLAVNRYSTLHRGDGEPWREAE